MYRPSGENAGSTWSQRPSPSPVRGLDPSGSRGGKAATWILRAPLGPGRANAIRSPDGERAGICPSTKTSDGWSPRTETRQSDRFTSHKWSQEGLGPHELRQLQVRDFEMLSAGTRYPLTYDCIREP